MSEKKYHIESIYNNGGFPTVQVLVRYDLPDGTHTNKRVNEFSSSKGLQDAKYKAQRYIDKIQSDGKHERAQLIISNRELILFWTIDQTIIANIPITGQVIESMRIFLDEYDTKQAMQEAESEGGDG